MAEFKLGRLRFVWQGPWVSATNYVKDDIVAYGGKTYVCLVGHTANAVFYTDLNYSTAKWSQMSDGVSWKGAWSNATSFYKINDIVQVGGKDYICLIGHVPTTISPVNQGFYTDLTANKWQLMVDGISWKTTWTTATYYNLGDIVKFGAKEFICVNGHVSSSTPNSGFYSDLAATQWQLFVDGQTFIGAWTSTTYYKIGDIVNYGGTSYICNNGHTSSTTLEVSQANWTTFIPGFAWLGVYSNGYTYKVNDIVKYGPDAYICIIAYTSATNTIDLTKWSLFVAGLEFMNTYSSATSYALGQVVTYGGYVYTSLITNNLNQTPSISPSYWSLVTTGFSVQGAWNLATAYKVGGVVTYGAYVYVSILDGTGFNPATNPTYWSLLNTGVSWQGLWTAGGAFTANIVTTNMTVSVVGSTYLRPGVVITGSTTSANTVITGQTSGTTGGVGVYTVNNSQTVGAPGAGQVTLTATSTYRLGDAVVYGPNSYICVAAHTSGYTSPTGPATTSNNRPDVDTAGTYWNTLALGSAANVLTTLGDTVYYSAGGNARLPIGEDGQILRVTGSVPTWNYFGQVSNVYYVAPSGTDATDYGITLDKPWKTVAYACARVAQGPANPSAQYLINQNKAWVGAEANNYLAHTNKVGVTGTTAGGAFTTTSTAGLAVNMPIVFNTFGGYLTNITQAYASQNLSVISSSGTLLTVSSNISGVVVNQPVTFTAGFGNVSSGTVYYIQSVAGTQFTISLTPSGTVYTVGGGGSGTAAVQGTFVVDSTVGFTQNVPFQVTGTTFGNLSLATNYFISNIISGTFVTFSASSGGAVLTNVTPASGTMAVTTNNTLTLASSALTTAAATITQTYLSQTLSVLSSSGTTITVSANMVDVSVNQPIVFSASFGTVDAGATYYVQAVSGTSLTIALNANGTPYTVGTGSQPCSAVVQAMLQATTTSNIRAGSSFTVSGAFGGLNSSTTYYTTRVLSTTLFQVSTTNGGPVISTLSAATGTATANQGRTYYVKTITTNTSFTVSNTFGGTAITAAGSGTVTGVLSYDGFKTQRDIQQILNAVVFDMGRGGNLSTTLVARAYYATATTYTSIVTQYLLPYFVSGLTYASTLTSTNVLGQTAPANNYQTLNSVASSITQFTSGSYTAEAGMNTKATTLFAIVTSGLNAGTTNAIPAPINPTTSIFIKTGTYSEILPISVPSFTALIGDELRSTIIQPLTFGVTATTSSGTSLTLSDATNVTVGMGISGNVYIPDGAFVVAKSGNVLTLNVGTSGVVVGALVAGYTVSDMFYMRNGTGARNMSVTGLFGTVGSVNSYGTARPTGGAYFSLDPGNGPDDDTVWIYSKSPYVQNVSLFGTGCVGCKIDGSLHAGGNKSITLNDFTNILSDGIAVWCTQLAKCEAVSVFSYYAYAGYLSEFGGAIRATNGNSSYGVYGCVAEGTSPTEVPIKATVNTQTQQAQVTFVLTGGGQVLWLEYSNAGQAYSSASYSITSGSGGGAAVSAANYFTNAVTEVRIITGGANYLTATNVAQNGTVSTIILSAADSAANNAYVGMRIVLQAGTGSGQYGFINYYNASTKQVIVLKESVAGIVTSTCSTTVFNVTSTANIPAGTPVVFTGTSFAGGSITNNTIFYVVANNFSATTFSVATAAGGTPITLTAGSGTMNIFVAMWDVAVSGTAVQTVLDGSTRYVIEPRITFSGSGTGAFARAVVATNQIAAIRIINPGSGYSSAPSITITDPNSTTAATTTVRVQPTGVLGQPTWASRGTNYNEATVTVTGNGFADFQALGFFINLSGMTAVPVPGANIAFTGNSTYYIVVQVLSYTGSAGNYSASIQINPGLTVTDSPVNGTVVTITIDYSQVRLTGHDFLYVGSGNFYNTGYPNNFSTANKIVANQTVNSAGGRVFFTATDQDGNFNVGNLFTVQQATGIATLSASLFNLSGLNQLQFASGGALVTQFSTDGNMTGNSDGLVPTQRAVRAYIASQLGAGGSNITANSLTAGSVYISGTTITTTNANNLIITSTGTQISVNNLAVFTRAQTAYVPTVDNDLTNKKYVDDVKSFAFFISSQ